MDDNQFDRIARVIGSGSSRRNVLKTLAGGTFAAAASFAGLGEASAAARKRGGGVVCSKNADCESDFCAPRDRTGRRYCDCLAESPAATCDGACGTTFNNCGQPVDCEPCCIERGQACEGDPFDVFVCCPYFVENQDSFLYCSGGICGGAGASCGNANNCAPGYFCNGDGFCTAPQ